MSSISLVNIKKSFGKEIVIPDLNLNIEDGSFTVLVGPSGCGKSTLLRMIAGLEKPTNGEIYIDGQNISQITPGKRGIAMVFQNYALYPTMNVRENIEFGLKNKKIPKDQRQEIIREVCGTVDLMPYLNRKPSELSGGQRQRVALARAMVKKPKVFLMDEPLSNLDAKLRAQMRIELIELHKRLGTTFIYVTHDQMEALSMADSIALMNKGVIMQLSSPKEIYHNPHNVFTAQFIGTPPMNILDMLIPGLSIGFRPEKTSFSDSADTALALTGEILTKEQLGAELNYSVKTQFGKVMVKSEEDLDDKVCTLFIKEKNLFVFHEDGNRIQMTSELLEQIKELSKGGTAHG